MTDYLGFPVTGVGQRQDDVIVGLGDGVAMPQAGQAQAVGGLQTLVGEGGVLFEPGEQRRPKVETQFLIVIDNIQDTTAAVINSGAAVGDITLCGNPGIPVMKGAGADLFFDLFDPGIFPGRLVKMAMDNHIAGGLAFGGGRFVCQGLIFPESLVDFELFRVRSILFRHCRPVNKSLGAQRKPVDIIIEKIIDKNLKDCNINRLDFYWRLPCSPLSRLAGNNTG
jgi:hypothetical protein